MGGARPVIDDATDAALRKAVAPDAAELTRRAKAHAFALGFDLVGVAELGPVESAPLFDDWLAAGRAGTMGYLERGAAKRRDTRLPMPGTTHAIVVALDYGGKEPSGPVARYARGDDYHDVMEVRLRELHARLEQDAGRSIAGKPYVDTGPILERDLARRAGLGWFGKNTNLLNPGLGSFFFLGSLVLDLALVPDAPFEADRCGSCTRCIDACPTDAIVAPRQLDATRCISYLTIEHKGEIPMELREQIGELVYGCDICQDVCPWNVRFARPSNVPEFAARAAIAGKDAVTLASDLLVMTQEEFGAPFKGSPMKRARLAGLQRNSSVVLGNIGKNDDVPILAVALKEASPLVRGHAAWALGNIRTPDALAALRAADTLESDAFVAREVRSALRGDG